MNIKIPTYLKTMRRLLKSLRLYRIITICKIPVQYFKKARKISADYNIRSFPIFWDMIRCLVKFGASDENYEQYHFWDHGDEYKNSFITWRRNMAIMYKFCTPKSKELFLDKVIWNRRFAKYVKRGWIYCKDCDIETIKNFLNEHNEVIVKRIDGACGVGVEKYKSTDILENNNLLFKLGGQDIIIEEVVTNAESIRKFSPSSLNTFRFVTCIDHSGVPHIIATAFRMGNGTSHTDNIVTGGIACYVNPETGIVATDGLNVEGKFFTEHPFSKITFKGFQIPQWNEARKLALDLAMEVPEARFVGWDIVLTDHGFDILEGNIPPGEELTELDMKGKYQLVMAMY